MKQKPKKYWTKERVFEDALTYSSYKEWHKKSHSAYNTALINKYLDEIMALFVSNDYSYKQGNTRFRWTNEKIWEEVKKYKRWSELRKANNGLYLAITRSSIEKEVKATLQLGLIIKWTRDAVFTEANKHSNESSWRTVCMSSYNVARRKGWLKEIQAIFRDKEEHKQIITRDEVYQQALKYRTRQDFQKGDYVYYKKAKQNGWLNDCCCHMLKKYPIWTKDRILKEIQNYSDYDQIKTKDALIRAIRRFKLQQEIKILMGYVPKVRVKVKRDKADVMIEAQKYKTRADFKDKSSSHYNQAVRDKYLDECCAHMPSIKEMKQVIRLEQLQKDKIIVAAEAKKYQTRAEFKMHARSAHKKANRHGWITEICEHMQPSERKPYQFNNANVKWTRETILLALKEIKNWRELCEKYQGLLGAINRLNLKDEMKSLFTTRVVRWTDQELKEEALKYTNKQLFRKERESMMRSIYERGLHKDFFQHMQKRQGRVDFLEVERKLLHPEIKKVFAELEQTFEYEKKFKIGEIVIIPDFIYEKNDVLYIVEAKTSYRKLRQSSINEQISEQKRIVSFLNPNIIIIHILLSEEGLIQSNESDYSMSIKEFSIFLESGYYQRIESQYSNKKELSKKIETDFRNEFLKDNNYQSSGHRKSVRGDKPIPTLHEDGESTLLN